MFKQRILPISNQSQIKVRDVNKISDILQQALDAGVNNIGAITFNVADTTALQGEARQKALVNAREKAEYLAKELGLTLGPVRQVIEENSTPMFDPYMGGMGGGGEGIPVAGGESGVTVYTKVIFDIQPN